MKRFKENFKKIYFPTIKGLFEFEVTASKWKYNLCEKYQQYFK